MWCERVVRRVANPENQDWGNKSVDWVDVAWNALGRVLKSSTRGGQSVRVLLPPGQRLAHGDVIFEDDSSVVVINMPACEVIVARPGDAAAAARLALELGNLHWPTQVGASGELIFVEEASALAATEKLEISWTREMRRFEPMAVAAATVQLAGEFEVIRSR